MNFAIVSTSSFLNQVNCKLYDSSGTVCMRALQGRIVESFRNSKFVMISQYTDGCRHRERIHSVSTCLPRGHLVDGLPRASSMYILQDTRIDFARSTFVNVGLVLLVSLSVGCFASSCFVSGWSGCQFVVTPFGVWF